jgi:leader peptidase (prepilin peptidase)/N-methyltransferase
MIAVVTTLFGSLIGSFLNVVVYRVPAGLSVVNPPSACPVCASRIRPYDNIPVVSWLVLRGRCRDCHTRIPVRYPLVEAGTALFFGLVALMFLGPLRAPHASVAGTALVVAAYLVLAAVSVALALIDLDVHRLPNALIVPAAVGMVGLLSIAAALDAQLGRLGLALVGGAALLVLYLVLALVRPGAMGLGDVKLAGLLGFALGWFGWGPLVVGAFAAFLLGGVFGVILLLTRRARRGSGIPFGPWMLAGAWIGIFFGSAIAAGYLDLIGVR